MPDRAVQLTLLTVVLTLVVTAGLLVGASYLTEFELFLGPVTVRSQTGATVPLAISAAPLPGPAARSGDSRAVARNLVLLVGDGFGVGQASTASMVLHGAGGGLVVERAPVVGLMRTACLDRPVTDSAASGTAMATGFKADYHAVSTLPDGRRPVTLFEAATAQGFAVGAVTTSGLVDATPASFTTHAASRYDYADILRQMLTGQFDLLIGGDYTLKDKPMGQADYVDVLRDAEDLAATGVTVVRDAAFADLPATPLVALLAPRPGSRTAYGPPLPETAAFALERLAGQGRGFVLLVESELTDDSGHDNDIGVLADAVAELDAAATTALEFAAGRDDTVVLVTADHDTGGVGFVSGREYGERVRVSWATQEHTSHWVPVYAFGPGAERFGGVFDNTELAVRMAAVLGVEGFPAVH